MCGKYSNICLTVYKYSAVVVKQFTKPSNIKSTILQLLTRSAYRNGKNIKQIQYTVLMYSLREHLVRY